MAGLLCLKWNNHSLAFLNLINDLHAKELYCDATIACHGKYYPVHRMVLSTCSEYFQDIFKLTQCKHPFVIVNDIQPSELEALLNYMYKGDVNVLQEMLPNLIKAAEALKVKGLAVPDELPPEKDSGNSRKRSSNSLNSSSHSKRSRVSEKTSRYVTSDVSQGSSEVNNEHSIPGGLPHSKNENGIHSLPLREDEIKVESCEGSVGGGGEGTSFAGLEAPFVAEPPPPPVMIKSEPYDDAEAAAAAAAAAPGYASHHDKEDQKGDFLHFSETVDWSSGSETTSQQPLLTMTSELPSQLNSEMDSASSRIFLSAANKMPASSLKLQEEVSSVVLPLAASIDPPIDKVFRCSQCSYQCRQKGNLQRHVKHIHTGEKPFSCIFCSYRCVSQDTLKTHLRKHTGEKPFACHCCSQRFADRSNYVKHMQFVHNAVNFKIRPKKL